MRTKLTVCQMGLSYAKYAQGFITESIHNELMKKNIESYVLYVDNVCSKDDNVFCVEGKLNSIVKRVLRKVFGKKQFVATLSTLKTLYYLHNIKPNIVHLHNIHHLTFNYKMLFRYFIKKNIGVVVTLHDMWPITGGCYHFSDIGCNGYKYECGNCPKKIFDLDCDNNKTHENYLFKKKCYELLNVHFVAVSDWVCSEVRKTYLNNFPITTIKNSLRNVCNSDLKCKNFFADSVYKNKKIILGVSNFWTQDKGLEDFYKLSELLDDSYIIVLIGTPPKDFIYKSNIVFYGKISNANDLYSAYTSADIFVHLSKAETFGLVIAEAASCGLVTIGYDCTGISEVVKDCNGILVEKGNVESIYKEIKKICYDNTKLDVEQTENIKKKFSLRSMNTKYLEVYDEVFNASRNKKNENRID